MDTAITVRRAVAAGALLVTAALSVASVVLQREFVSGGAGRLAAIEAAGTSAAVSAVTFTLAQLPFIAAVLGIAHLLRRRTPWLALVGVGLGVIGAFGHSVFGGVSLLSLVMADGAGPRSAYGAVLDDFEASPFMAFAAMGLLGTVLGLLLLAVGLWRGAAAPRWVPVALVAFLVVEFVGSNFTEWASLISSLLYLACFAALAVTILRTTNEEWAAADGAPASGRTAPPLAPAEAGAR